ncbi:MAG: iron-sulfur cluster assembly accessory protein [Gammaproteobacteria bacterium]|jgi:iron-sulfur cluster assembly protein|nr:iron-sulfur cluster assembly accessory protein [Gammaproteobacteria bacterium]MBT3490469.1 iron-sulfur cluster assembly accessory protein [Gammaproteobacteria bacterium]MBT3717600.1 iron-sulfur cluster assembly accessory protein [Gammaproteobacteria bacterium]MBT3845793.1 iron-sulfur cluster assembly accessory protein [Gammaproteobacteria bacterium]MBT3893599.1 iron-sulfur cluster assembly accessory protein [Gammaproteobacteria bacterium]
MIIVTENALNFIRHSAESGAIEEELGLRVAIKEASDGGYDYGIGFDEKREKDLEFKFDGVTVLINEELQEYLEDATLDYVELEDGQMSLIVLNPNDPTYEPPKRKKKH